MYKYISKLFEFLTNIIMCLFIILIIIAIYSLVLTKMLEKPYTDILGYTAFEVVTGSMSGTIEIGDVIIVKLLNQDEIHEGNIVVFKQDGNLITHRVKRIAEDKVITKGDANNAEDEPIKKEDIVGKVIRTMPNAGIWKKVILTPQVLISVTTTIMLFGLTVSYGKQNDNKSIMEENTKNEEKNNK